MRKYNARYTVRGRHEEVSVVAETVSFVAIDDGAVTRAVFSNYCEKSSSFVVVAAFEFSALISLTSEAV